MKTMIPIGIWLAVMMGQILPSVLAGGFSPREQRFVDMLAREVSMYHSINESWPQSWEDMQNWQFGTKDIDAKYSSVTPTKRYAFIREDVTIVDSQRQKKYKILILGRSPVRANRSSRGLTPSRLSPPLQYAVLVEWGENTKGETFGRSYTKEQIQELFLKAKVPMPSPDPLGLRPYEIQEEVFSLIYLIMVGGLSLKILSLGFLALYKMYREIRNRAIWEERSYIESFLDDILLRRLILALLVILAITPILPGLSFVPFLSNTPNFLVGLPWIGLLIWVIIFSEREVVLCRLILGFILLASLSLFVPVVL